MMNLKGKIGAIIKVVVVSTAVVVSIAFTETTYQAKVCTGIEIKIKGAEEHEFLTKDQLIDELTNYHTEEIIGGKLIHINSKAMELRLKRNKFVKRAEVLKDLKGNLIVEVLQDQPIARVISKDSSYYINESGQYLPLSNHYSARVLLVFGENIDSLASTNYPENEGLLNVIKYVNQDKFLSAQVASMEMDSTGELKIFPQVTNTLIEFGQCEYVVDKFEKLQVFYQQILPRKGWTSYKRVNLNYRDQIICE